MNEATAVLASVSAAPVTLPRPDGRNRRAAETRRKIIDAAKADGILNAVAHHTHYGYSGNGTIQSNNQELPNSSLNLCVELIARRDQLEQFCRKHGDLMKGKVIVYKHMEHWDIGPHESLKVKEAAQEELDADVQDS